MRNFTDIPEINQENLKKILTHTINTNTNVIIFGHAGIGKTEMSIQACKAAGREYIYLNLSVLEAPDLLGIPVVNKNKTNSSYALPAQFPIRGSGPDKVLIVDEIDKAKPELQAPMLELFQFRSINGQPLGFNSVIATGNRPDEGAFSMPVNKALTNRCKNYQFNAECHPWLDWGLSNGIHPIILGFLRKNSDLFLKPNKSGDSTAYSSPSPRSWTLASKELLLLEESNVIDSNFVELITSGYVGLEASSKLKIWMNYYQKITPLIDNMINNKVKPELNSIDEQFVAGIYACNELKFLASKKDEKLEEKMNLVFSWIKTFTAEIKEGILLSCFNLEVINKYNFKESNSFMKIFSEASTNRMNFDGNLN